MSAVELEVARAALAAFDDPSIDIVGPDGFPLIGSVERFEWIINQMRPVIEAAPVDTYLDESGCERDSATHHLTGKGTAQLVNWNIAHGLLDGEPIEILEDDE